MGFKNEMTNEELEQIAGGVTPNLIIGKFPSIPVPGEPLPGENVQFILP